MTVSPGEVAHGRSCNPGREILGPATNRGNGETDVTAQGAVT
ncbi:hypothetical protein ACFQZ8_01610 [Micromonospora azadirachtae]|uniref:Uncharacterized protein n=1 Tax=Micromonospora azadirachtae TaxID=1970735 RepID=A0ABW2ZVK4_9ACTN